MTRTTRLLGAAAATTLVVALAPVALAAPAQAAPKMTVSGNSNLKGGERLQVRVTGFSASAPVAIGICPTGRVTKGPGDCGPASKGYSVLTTANASGVATATLTVPPLGKPLGNLTAPKVDCPPCSVSAANIGQNTQRATTRLNYAKPAAAPKPKSTPSKSRSSNSSSTSGKAAASTTRTTQAAAADTSASTSGSAADATQADGEELAATGPAETAAIGLTALALVVAGLGLHLGARRTGRHRV